MLTTDQVRYLRASHPVIAEKVARAFSVLGEKNRLSIFCLIIEHRDLCVSDVAKVLNASVPAASQQLKIMEYSGLVKRIRMGKSVCYEVNASDPFVQRVITLIKQSYEGEK